MTDGTLLRQVKRLHDYGFALHLLHKKSKRPIESAWTTGARKSWNEIEASYQDGLNIGVRLGTPSKIADKYLAVVDVDVKSKDVRHQQEAAAKVTELFKGAALPEARSGRGNNSRHYYLLTEKPVTPRTLFKSNEIVKVQMPSVTPSKKELAQLTTEELDAGLRLRPAWELSLMGDGQQVVLPPSIHCDSGLTYEWRRDFDPTQAFCNLDFLEAAESSHAAKAEMPTPVSSKPSRKALEGFAIEDVELSWLPISDKIRNMILNGEGVEDRSASLMSAALALIKAGLTQNEILSVLTDPNTYLGKTGFDHAKTKDRARAANWIYKHTYLKAASIASAEALFAAPMIEGEERGSEAVAADQSAFEEGRGITPEDGFYVTNEKGGLTPDYDALLGHFKNTYPFKMVADMKSVFIFDKTHYKYFTPIEVKGFAEENFNPKPPEKYRNEFLNKVSANEIVCKKFFVDTIENKINFKNGVLEIGEAANNPKLVPHSPEYGFQAVLPYNFDPEAKCPFFLNWLEQIMLSDKDLMAILQEFMGYIVRGGEYRYHKALWLGGTGRNGKSTFIDLLKALIGSDNFSTISIKALVGDRFAGAELDGRLANFSEETSPKELADSGPFKNLTGDGEISAQRKFGAPYKFRNRAKMVMTYNQIPDIKDLSKGMLSRPLIVPFEKEIADGDQDHDIKKKLFKELPGIFNFALKGWERLETQNQFTKSERSEIAMQKVKEESCNVFQWVENYVEFNDELNDPHQKIRPAELYDAYCKKEKYSYSSIEFYRRLNRHPKIKDRHKRTTEGVQYVGLKVHGGGFFSAI
jgi:P4 family phage/plasmid primase-like protien